MKTLRRNPDQHAGSVNSVICPGCAAQGQPTHRYCAGCGLRLVPPTGWTEPAVRTQRRTVTVLFVDMVGFTRLASRLTPEAVRQVQLRYFHAVRSVIHRHHGVVEKYIGDAVMAVFGAGTDRAAAAYRAVRAATELPRAVRDAEFPAGVQAQIRVGVATGVAAVDVAGAVDGAVGFLTGDVINIAARLQAHATPGTVAIAATTYHAARTVEARWASHHPGTVGDDDGPRVAYLRQSPMRISGRDEPVQVWRPVPAWQPVQVWRPLRGVPSGTPRPTRTAPAAANVVGSDAGHRGDPATARRHRGVVLVRGAVAGRADSDLLSVVELRAAGVTLPGDPVHTVAADRRATVRVGRAVGRGLHRGSLELRRSVAVGTGPTPPEDRVRRPHRRVAGRQRDIAGRNRRAEVEQSKVVAAVGGADRTGRPAGGPVDAAHPYGHRAAQAVPGGQHPTRGDDRSGAGKRTVLEHGGRPRRRRNGAAADDLLRRGGRSGRADERADKSCRDDRHGESDTQDWLLNRGG